MDKTYAGMSYEEVVEKYSELHNKNVCGYGHKMKKQLKIVFKIHL